MNRTIKEATVRRYHYDSHDQLREHLQTFLDAYNFARRLKTLRGMTPYGYICNCWTETPDQFTQNPFHHTPGLNRLCGKCGSIAAQASSDNQNKWLIPASKFLI